MINDLADAPKAGNGEDRSALLPRREDGWWR